jgi:transcriptional regulator with XRE-family HTH domain
LDFAEKIKAERKARGLSQELVARRAGISLSAYRNLERGDASDPHFSTLRGIAGALGVSVRRLIEDEPETPKGPAPSLTSEDEERRKHDEAYFHHLIGVVIYQGKHVLEEMRTSPDENPLGSVGQWAQAVAALEKIYKENAQAPENPTETLAEDFRALDEIREDVLADWRISASGGGEWELRRTLDYHKRAAERVSKDERRRNADSDAG